MALTKLTKINDNSFWAVWKVEESVDELLRLLNPSPADLYQMEAVHHPVKKQEWIAGRLALHYTLQAVGITDYCVTKDNHGKPFLHQNGVHISLANSYPYAVAIVHTKMPVGIDIEKPSSKLLKVSRKFLSPRELQAAKEDQHILCAFWCAKETIYKIYGRRQLSFKKHIQVEFSHLVGGTLYATINAPFHSSHHQLILHTSEEYLACYNVS